MKKTILLLLILIILLNNGCNSIDEYCNTNIKCMEEIAKEHCKENDCIVVSVGNMLCGKQTTILDRRTREKIDFNFLPEDYEKCGINI